MIDTIKLELYVGDIPPEVLKKELAFIQFKEGANGSYGKYENFSVRLINNVLFVEGSLNKYFLGNNVEIMIPDQTTQALLRMKKDFGKIPILKGNLRRVDMAECFILDEDIRNYLLSFKDTPNFERSKTGKSVKYRFGKGGVTTGKREIAIYDKTPEALKELSFRRSILMPDGIKDVLRIELRYKAGIRKWLSQYSNKLFGVHLFADSFRRVLANEWHRHYCRLLHRKHTVDIPVLHNWVEMKSYMSAMLLAQYNMADWFHIIDLIAEKSNWSARKRSDIRKNCTDLYRFSAFLEDNKYQQELKDKIDRGVIMTQYLTR